MLKPILPIMLLGLALSMPVEATRSYGPVKDQDTLWNIATQLRPDQRATVQQTMLALYYKNPQAFASNNINSLMKGAVLTAPSSAEARRYQRIGALREARKHNAYWARGAQLPYSAPPPVPKIKERANPKRSKVVTVKASVSEASTPRSTVRSTERRINRLQTQLQTVESKNQRLTAELQALQAKQAKQTQSKPNPQLDAQVKKLKLELQELTSVLSQKDNHIKTLQASLKNASETIKSQHADNMRLYDKLKEVSPSSLPASPSSEGKSELKLTTVEAATAAVVSNNQDNKDKTPKSVWADQQTTSTQPPSTAPTGSTSAGSAATESAPTGSTPTGSTPTGSTPTGSTPTGSTPTGSTPTGSTPTGSTSAESTPTGSTSTESTPIGSTPIGSAPSKANNTSDPKAAVSPEPQANATTAATSTTAEASKVSPESPTLAAATPNTTTTATPSASSSTASEIKAPSGAQAVAQLTPTNDVKTSGSVPVSQMLAQPNSVSTPVGDKANANSASLRGVSPLALAIALISLLFILALVWRAFLQHREMRQLEQEEARMAERMRKRLAENQAATTTNLVDRKETDLESNTEIKF